MWAGPRTRALGPLGRHQLSGAHILVLWNTAISLVIICLTHQSSRVRVYVGLSLREPALWECWPVRVSGPTELEAGLSDPKILLLHQVSWGLADQPRPQLTPLWFCIHGTRSLTPGHSELCSPSRRSSRAPHLQRFHDHLEHTHPLLSFLNPTMTVQPTAANFVFGGWAPHLDGQLPKHDSFFSISHNTQPREQSRDIYKDVPPGWLLFGCHKQGLWLWLAKVTGMKNKEPDAKSPKSFFFFLGLFRSSPAAYGGSQARGPIRAVATGLCQSHSNTGPKPPLWPTPQLMATLDPQPTVWGQATNPQSHGSYSDLFLLRHDGNSFLILLTYSYFYI